MKDGLYDLERIEAERIEAGFRVSLKDIDNQDANSLLYLISNLKRYPKRAISEPCFSRDLWTFTCYSGADNLAHLFEMMGADVKIEIGERECLPTYYVTLEGSSKRNDRREREKTNVGPGVDV